MRFRCHRCDPVLENRRWDLCDGNVWRGVRAPMGPVWRNVWRGVACERRMRVWMVRSRVITGGNHTCVEFLFWLNVLIKILGWLCDCELASIPCVHGVLGASGGCVVCEKIALTLFVGLQNNKIKFEVKFRKNIKHHIHFGGKRANSPFFRWQSITPIVAGSRWIATC